MQKTEEMIKLRDAARIQNKKDKMENESKKDQKLGDESRQSNSHIKVVPDKNTNRIWTRKAMKEEQTSKNR